ncbi:hypothetical protein [Ancylobacter oerskovii]|uniref:Uncharacterized protein n=1 Tax=Ancylobacter oerskovii TaxID=459519 RepID=A0ABW4Z338_9HYPH|nr:hypothetical protein [Ancylobacter oerskovii]MBS7546133.1 hypothetical protein [Ancylobacter oerskovii]
MSIADHSLETPATIPAVRVRAGSAEFDILTLDEALSFAQANPHPRGDYDGLIRRLQIATDPEDVIEAGNAFRWWAESNGIAVEPHA